MMNRLLHLVLGGTVLCVSITSCIDFTRRHGNLREPKLIKLRSKFAPLYVEVDASSFTVEKPAPPVAPAEKETRRSITSLAPQAQQELIKSLASRTTLTTLLKSLGDPFPITEAPPVVALVNRSRSIGNTITKRLVISVGKTIDGDGIADRIVEIQYGVLLLDSATAIFNTWDSFESKYGIIDLGKVSSSQGLELTATINAKAGGSVNLSNSAISDLSTNNSNTTQSTASQSNATPASSSGITGNTSKNTDNTGKITTSTFDVGPSAGATYNTKYESSRQLTNRLLVFNGMLHETKMIFTQKGEQSYDVEGNSSVVVECKLKEKSTKHIIITKFKKLYTGKKQVPVLLDTLKPERIIVAFPDIKQDVKGQLQYKFTYRRVKGGSQNVAEARQRVEHVYGQVGYPSRRDTTKAEANTPPKAVTKTIVGTKQIILLKKEDFHPITFRITAGTNHLSLNKDILNFDTRAEAADFLAYLYTYLRLHSTGNAKLKLGTAILDETKLSSLVIKEEAN